eukprot:TRINITY_DN186_c0_g1_i1.p1 TRINITY_DN186_c0_g1~~TRINITY_DN186_c0_g1_i1.p1  ORF type:complete len:399 (-),score=105.13 TRINITY_DN186_c0_g1_i1:106-1302(-)
MNGLDACRQVFDELWKEDFLVPLSAYMAFFKEASNRVKERERRRLDMDRYREDVRELSEKQKEPGKIQQAKEKHYQQIEAYKDVNAELIRDLPRLVADVPIFLEPIVGTVVHGFNNYYLSCSSVISQIAPKMAPKGAVEAHLQADLLTHKDVSAAYKPISSYLPAAQARMAEKQAQIASIQAQQQPGGAHYYNPADELYGAPPPGQAPPGYGAAVTPGYPPAPASHSPATYHSTSALPPAPAPAPAPGYSSYGHPAAVATPPSHYAHPAPVVSPGYGGHLNHSGSNIPTGVPAAAKPAAYRPKTAAPTGGAGRALPGVARGAPKAPGAPGAPGAAPGGGVSPRGVKARALYSFAATDAGELGFNVGDILTIHQQSGQWWTAELNGKRGSIPFNYVELI